MTQVFPIVSNNGYGSAPNVDITTVGTSGKSMRCWMRDGVYVRLSSRVDANQLTSLSAMIAYAAAKTGKSEFGIERSLSDQFKIPNAKFLPAKQFEDAIRYLVDTIPVS